MSWSSKTKQFGEEEMAAIEAMNAHDLETAILGSDPVVALRILAELMLSESTGTLTTLLQSDTVNTHWQQFEENWGLDDRDRDYARKLKAMIDAN